MRRPARELYRRNDPETSRSAAESLDAGPILWRLLAVHRDRALIADEAADEARCGPHDGAWKRLADLDRLGLIADTGERRTGNAGRKQMVRAITELGRQELAQHEDPGWI